MLSMYANFWMWIFDLLGGLFTKVTGWFTNTLFPFVKELPAKILAVGKAMWDWIGEKAQAAIGVVKDKFASLVEWVKGLPARIAGAAANLWGSFRDSFRDALNWIINKWNAFRIDARFPPDFIVPFLRNKGFTLDTPNIPNLAKGGVIQPTPGGTLARIAEAGRPERVEPLDEDGLSKRDKAIISMLSGGNQGGNTFNVYPSEGMDERELAEMVSRLVAFQVRRGVA